MLNNRENGANKLQEIRAQLLLILFIRVFNDMESYYKFRKQDIVKKKNKTKNLIKLYQAQS
jgi:hypothetical protein